MARKSDPMMFALIVCALLVWASATYFALQGPRSLLGAATPTPSTPTASAASTVGPSATATATASASASASASAAPELVDPSTCMIALFTDDAFKKTPDLSFVCSIANPLKGSTEVKSQVVLGSSGGVSQAMREWAGLGWYEMAAYSLLRSHCCPEPPELKWTFDLVCPVDEALRELEAAVRKKDAAGVEAFLERYTKEVHCLSQFGQADNFGKSGPAGAGSVALRLYLERAGFNPK